MSKKMKIWLVCALGLILVGGIIFGGVMTVLKWNFSSLGAGRYETNRYDVGESYEDISIVADTADIAFVTATDGKTTVTVTEPKKAKHILSVENGVLKLSLNDQRRWYERLFGFGGTKITVAIPAGEYGALQIYSKTGDVLVGKDFVFESAHIALSTGTVKYYASALGEVSLKTSTGDVEVENVSVGSLSLSVTTGDGELENVTAKSFSSSGSTGELSLKNVITEERISIKRSTGDIFIMGCDAAEIFAETDTGNVKGTLLSEKIFVAETNTGKIIVPESTRGGICKITTDTGNIIFSVIER